MAGLLAVLTGFFRGAASVALARGEALDEAGDVAGAAVAYAAALDAGGLRDAALARALLKLGDAEVRLARYQDAARHLEQAWEAAAGPTSRPRRLRVRLAQACYEVAHAPPAAASAADPASQLPEADRVGTYARRANELLLGLAEEEDTAAARILLQPGAGSAAAAAADGWDSFGLADVDAKYRVAAAAVQARAAEIVREGEAMVRAGRYEEAGVATRAWFTVLSREALFEYPAGWRVFLAAGTAYLRLGDLNPAHRCLNSAHMLRPAHPEVNLRLGQTLFDMHRRALDGDGDGDGDDGSGAGSESDDGILHRAGDLMAGALMLRGAGLFVDEDPAYYEHLQSVMRGLPALTDVGVLADSAGLLIDRGAFAAARARLEGVVDRSSPEEHVFCKLGMLYHHGLGGPVDVARALDLYRRSGGACEDALVGLALCLEGGDCNGDGEAATQEEAARAWRAAASDGAKVARARCLALDGEHAGAVARYLALMTKTGKDEDDSDRAVAPTDDDTIAAFLLGCCYEHGRGVARDLAAARRCYEAAAAGHVRHATDALARLQQPVAEDGHASTGGQ